MLITCNAEFLEQILTKLNELPEVNVVQSDNVK